MRASGHSLCSSFARVGGFLAPFLVFSNASIVTVSIVLGIVNVLAAICSTLLPETSCNNFVTALW